MYPKPTWNPIPLARSLSIDELFRRDPLWKLLDSISRVIYSVKKVNTALSVDAAVAMACEQVILKEIAHDDARVELLRWVIEVRNSTGSYPSDKGWLHMIETMKRLGK